MSDAKTMTVRREGDLSIRHASDLKSELEDALSTHPRVAIDFDGVNAADVTILQILIGAHRMAASRDAALEIRVAPDGALAAALAGSGILTSADTRLVWRGDVWTGLAPIDGEKAA